MDNLGREAGFKYQLHGHIVGKIGLFKIVDEWNNVKVKRKCFVRDDLVEFI